VPVRWRSISSLGFPLALLAFFTVNAAPFVPAIAAWLLLHRLIVRHDIPPYTYSRFAFALLIAWVVDGFLFRVTVGGLPGLYRHFVPAIVVVSAFVAFYAWRELPQKAIKSEQWFMREKLIAKTKAEGTPGNPLITFSHPFAIYLSLLLMLFSMTYAIMPVLAACFPRYNSYWSDMLGIAGDRLQSSDNERPGGEPP
jgi:hypothetical protein